MENQNNYPIFEREGNIVSQFVVYFIKLDFKDEHFKIEVNTYNCLYYNSPIELVNAYGLFFNDLLDFNNSKGKKLRVMDFLNDSVQNNVMLNDSIEELNFKIKGEHILFKQNGEKQDFINMGEFYIDNYKVNVCGSYMFFEDLKGGKKYMYYGD